MRESVDPVAIPWLGSFDELWRSCRSVADGGDCDGEFVLFLADVASCGAGELTAAALAAERITTR